MSNYQGFDEAVKYAKAVSSPNGTYHNASAETNLAKEFLKLLPSVDSSAMEAARETVPSDHDGIDTYCQNPSPNTGSASKEMLGPDQSGLSDVATPKATGTKDQDSAGYNELEATAKELYRMIGDSFYSDETHIKTIMGFLLARDAATIERCAMIVEGWTTAVNSKPMEALSNAQVSAITNRDFAIANAIRALEPKP